MAQKGQALLKLARVLSVQSHVVHGYVGNKCAVFPLQLLGYEVDYVNSVQFAAHTGYPHHAGTVLGGSELDDLVDGLEKNGLLSHSYLLTGYIGSPAFLRSIIKIVAKLRAANAEFSYVCDPVLGDNGAFYVPEELIQIYREEVLPLASVATPNQFEIESLTGIKIKNEQDAIQACRCLHEIGLPIVVITTLEYDEDADCIQMMLSIRDSRWSPYLLKVPKLKASFTGSGDLTSALLLAWMHTHQKEPALALEKSAASVYTVLRATADHARHIIKTDDPSCTQVPPELRLIASRRFIEEPPLHSEAFTPIARLAHPPKNVRRIVLDSSLFAQDKIKQLQATLPDVSITAISPTTMLIPTFTTVEQALSDISPEERIFYVTTPSSHAASSFSIQDERLLTVAYLGDDQSNHDNQISLVASADFTISDLIHLRRFFPS